jgi:ABC-2 type transport system permease protein
MFIAPISRVTIVAGKVVGETLVACVQGPAILAFGLVFGVRCDASHLLLMAPACLTSALLGAAFGLAALATLPNQRAALQVMPFVVLPQYFLGGVVAPIGGLPTYLGVIAWAMPMRYPIDLTRAAYYLGQGGYTNAVAESPVVDAAVAAVLFTLFLLFGAVVFDRRERAR